MNDGFGRFVSRSLALGLWFLFSLSSVENAEVQAEPVPASDGFHADGLDGFHVAVGPLGAVTRASGEWDGNFGVGAQVMRIREESIVTSLGVGAGASRYARADDAGLGRGSGRVWLESSAGFRLPGGLVMGLGAGVVAEVDAIRPARWGAQGTVWVFAGVIPYVRVGSVEKNGAYIDFGIKVALPVLRI